MPKHAFRLPQEVIEAVRSHVRGAIDAVDPVRYRQEANYTAALLNRLEGIVYSGPYGLVEFKSTVFDDRGRHSAESRLGADHAIIATIEYQARIIKKVILFQAKLGDIQDLNSDQNRMLEGQIEKMRRLVAAPKVMQIPESNGKRYPQIISGNSILGGRPYKPLNLENYFVARVTTTLDGCTDPAAIEIASESSLSRLEVHANIKRIKSEND